MWRHTLLSSIEFFPSARWAIFLISRAPRWGQSSRMDPVTTDAAQAHRSGDHPLCRGDLGQLAQGTLLAGWLRTLPHFWETHASAPDTPRASPAGLSKVVCPCLRRLKCYHCSVAQGWALQRANNSSRAATAAATARSAYLRSSLRPKGTCPSLGTQRGCCRFGWYCIRISRWWYCSPRWGSHCRAQNRAAGRRPSPRLQNNDPEKGFSHHFLQRPWDQTHTREVTLSTQRWGLHRWKAVQGRHCTHGCTPPP